MVAEPVGVWGGGLCGRDLRTGDSLLAKWRLVLKPGDGLFIRGGLEMDGNNDAFGMPFFRKEFLFAVTWKKFDLSVAHCGGLGFFRAGFGGQNKVLRHFCCYSKNSAILEEGK